ncbi:MAG TPA: hypothetical protein VL985_07545 [Stellaceae bacterium]|nr:hypothetical protein [Stellaceae bacterium]
MMLKTLAGALAVAGLLATAAVVPAAQAQPDGGHAWARENGQWVWSPRLNIVHSERYSRLVATDRPFRREAMRVECGPITDPALHQQCVQSFFQNVQAWRNGQAQAYYRDALSGESYGSSTPPQPYISSAGQ